MVICVVCMLFIALCGTVSAIDNGDFGILGIMDNDSDLYIGAVVYPISWLQLRPSVLFYHGSGEVEYEEIIDRFFYDSIRFGGMLDVLFTFEVAENTYLYLGPRAEFFYLMTTETNDRFPTSSLDNFDREYYDIELHAVFGAQYMFSDNFGFFGDIAFGARYRIETYYYHDTVPDTVPDRRSTDWYFRTLQGNIGMQFIF